MVLGLLLAYLAGPSPGVHFLADSSLVFHVLVEHTLLLGAGVLLAAASRSILGNSTGLPGVFAGGGILLAASVVAWWHLPKALSWAMATDLAHGTMHLSLLAAGWLLAVCGSRAGPRILMLVLALWQAGMGLLAIALYSGAVRYPSYPARQSVSLGVWLLVLMMPMLLALLALPWLAPASARWWARASVPPAANAVVAFLAFASIAVTPWLPRVQPWVPPILRH